MGKFGCLHSADRRIFRQTLLLQEIEQRPDGRKLPGQRARRGTVPAPVCQKRPEIVDSQIIQKLQRNQIAKMLLQEVEKLPAVAHIGLNRLGRHPAFALKMIDPGPGRSAGVRIYGNETGLRHDSSLED